MKYFIFNRPQPLPASAIGKHSAWKSSGLGGSLALPDVWRGGTCLFLLLLLAVLTPGCLTMRPLPPVDLAQSGWVVRQGQAVWRSKATAPEIAGELVLAARPDGASFLQFTKTPLPFVVAQTTGNAWQIQFVPENRTFSGPGKPPRRLLWLHLARCLQGICDEKHFIFKSLPNGNQVLEDRRTGESIEFYLTPPDKKP